MEAFSVEDNGKGVSFNVFVNNIQPGIDINYADGTSSYNMPVTPDTNEPETSVNNKTRYVLNKNPKSMRFHYPDCASAKKIKAENYGESNLTRDELIANGYIPCGNCDP